MTNLCWLWNFSKKIMLSFKRMHFCSMFRINHKKILGKLIEKLKDSRSWVHFEGLKIYFKRSPSQTFPCKFSKSFQKTSNCCIVEDLTRTKSVLVWKEKQEERIKPISQLTSFFGAKCFLFCKFIYKWLLQHNISYAIYLLLSICIPSLSVLDQSRIQNL